MPAARFFVDSEPPAAKNTGTAGVRWLASRLEDFVDRDTDAAQDDRFVEGAGAFLGLLLIDHLGGQARERDGCHRVQLGRFGWFDPFVAIQDSLDAEDPRACLADYLAAAEREAVDDGPVSRVVRTFAEALDAERPDLGIASQFELTVDLSNGASVDLASLERVTRDEDPTAATDAARRIVSMLPGATTEEATPWHEAASRVLPRLVSAHFLDSLPGDRTLHTEPLGADIHVALQVRYGSRSRYLRDSEVYAWPVSHSLVQCQALENLAAKSRSLRLEPVADGVMRVRQGDGLDGARLVLPDLAARLGRVKAGPWAASAPHRDILLLAHQSAVEALGKYAEDAARRAPHPISGALFDITASGPRPLPR